MKLVYVAALLLTFSCAHHHKESAHHHHDKDSCENCAKQDQIAFDHKCAHAVLEGDDHVEGKEEFSLKHGGKTYYFSSKDRMEKFKANLTENIQRANTQWQDRKRL